MTDTNFATKYIYLQKYIYIPLRQTFYYVGSHKWFGSGIDPNYKGSSFVHNNCGYDPVIENWEDGDTIILMDCTNFCDRDFAYLEKEWISSFVAFFGTTDKFPEMCNSFAKCYSHDNGLMLNRNCSGHYSSDERRWCIEDSDTRYYWNEICGIFNCCIQSNKDLGNSFIWHHIWIHDYSVTSKKDDIPEIKSYKEAGMQTYLSKAGTEKDPVLNFRRPEVRAYIVQLQRENGHMQRMTELANTPEKNVQRSETLRQKRKEHPELWTSLPGELNPMYGKRGDQAPRFKGWWIIDGDDSIKYTMLGSHNSLVSTFGDSVRGRWRYLGNPDEFDWHGMHFTKLK